jgi:hypothetical protein
MVISAGEKRWNKKWIDRLKEKKVRSSNINALLGLILSPRREKKDEIKSEY